eukprot:g8296.t1
MAMCLNKVLVALMIVLGIAGVSAAEEAKGKKTDLEGTWKAVKEDSAVKMLKFTGNRFEATIGGNVYSGTFKLRNDENPLQIDMKISKTPVEKHQGKTTLGIYEFQDVPMKIPQLCVAAFAALALTGVAEAQKTKSSEKTTAKKGEKSKPKKKKAVKLPFKTMKENMGYAIGFNFSRRLVADLKRQGLKVNQKGLDKALQISDDTVADMKKQGLDLDKKQLHAGFATGISGGKSVMSDEQLGSVFQEIQKIMLARAQKQREEQMKAQIEARKKQMARLKVLADKNKKEGQLFLAKNAKKKGVKTTKSGLQYEVIKEGKGKSPKASDTVVTHYRGTFLDGTEFDSSVKRGTPAEFGVSEVIKGWTEALQLMKVGSKWKLYIPSYLAYGPNGSRSGRIGPNATLVFEIELISVKKTPEKKESPKSPKS